MYSFLCNYMLARPRRRAADLPARKAAGSGSPSISLLWVTVGYVMYRTSSGSWDHSKKVKVLEAYKKVKLHYKDSALFKDILIFPISRYLVSLAPEKGFFTDAFRVALLCLLKSWRWLFLILSQSLPKVKHYCSVTLPLNSLFSKALYRLPRAC